MRRYVITLIVLALTTGALYQAADATGSGLLSMFATMGLFLIGAVGTLALNRHQQDSGLKEIHQALKSLEPESLITDWSADPGERPDYLVIGPDGLCAICVEEVPQTTPATKAMLRISASRKRVASTTAWTKRHLLTVPDDWLEQVGKAIPVYGLVILSRRRADPAFTAEQVTVLNADQVAEHLRPSGDEPLLSREMRVRLTRHLRQQPGS